MSVPGWRAVETKGEGKMSSDWKFRKFYLPALIAAALLIAAAPARAQQPAEGDGAPAVEAGKAAAAQAGTKPSFEVYGFAMLDIGHDFKQINPNWSDTMRVTKLPSSPNQFGEDNNTFAGVRQSRLGVRSTTPTALGDLKTTFEFELFGTGVDEGQTTFRLRHAYGELGKFGAGQTWSPFMDPDVFPNTLEYWGPTGMVFFRNVQLRWMPVPGAILALERPGASGDQGVYADRIELQNIKARFPLPDLSGAYKQAMSWGYVRGAGMFRIIKYDDVLNDQYDLSGTATGWGINLSSNINAGKSDVIRLQWVFGEGIQNYMNDSPVDVGVENNLSDPVRPIKGDSIPIHGLVAFVDHKWNEQFTSMPVLAPARPTPHGRPAIRPAARGGSVASSLHRLR